MLPGKQTKVVVLVERARARRVEQGIHRGYHGVGFALREQLLGDCRAGFVG
jgi:hypothetical protein